MMPAPRNLITDVPGLLVGNAHDAALASGVTVLTAQERFTAGVMVMGGAPGTRETDLLAPDKSVSLCDAIVLAGGSALGLSAGSGVADALFSAGRGHPVGPLRVPIVPGAILFDLFNGGRKDWEENPYPALGRAALAAAACDFALGSAGAGFGATCADIRGGLGSASALLPSGHIVGALVAVNAVGSPLVAGGPHFWAAPFEEGAEFGGLGPALARPHHFPTKLGGATEATTLAIVATDAALDKAGCQRLATAAHDGLARALVPSHSPHDGDIVFAVSTGSAPAPGPLEALQIGHAAATCLARAVARAVFCAAPGGLLPAWQERFA